MDHTNTQLIDQRTPAEVLEVLKAELEGAELIGIDCETQDEARHSGLKVYNNKKRHVFDHNRTVMTGFSVHVDGSNTSWYINLAHADRGNRLSAAQGIEILEWMSDKAIKVAHNAPFELVMFSQCLGVVLTNLVCTMQLAVTHHGPDNYDRKEFLQTPLKSFWPCIKDVETAFASYDSNSRGRDLTGAQYEVLQKFISKTSRAAHSYNGFVFELAYGYALKKLVMSLFGFKMTTYDEVLQAHDAKHMGELTGDQVANYGADDAYWAVQVYKKLSENLMVTNPAALVTFIKTENPMVQVYADSWRDGLRLDLPEVYVRRDIERENMAKVLRSFKEKLMGFAFSPEKNEKLAAKQPWYKKNWESKRAQLNAWIRSPDNDDDFAMCFQVSNPIGNAWALEKGITLPKNKLNLTHYYGARTLLYDLLDLPLMYDMGKVASDADARGKMSLAADKAGDEHIVAVLKDLQQMADIEQRVKLYLTPYTQLMDPDTSRVYPSLSSKLASRRMAASFPNPMQLAKQGESAYVRGFFLADDDDHLVVSADWSSVELVLIGDMSDDLGFKEVFGQLPYGDLHSGAAADGLAVKTLPGMTEEEFKMMKFGGNPEKRILKHIQTGAIMEPGDFHKMARGDVGKVSNFNYWYSGSLSTVGSNLGWTGDEMWAAVDKYRQRFPLAEKWRIDTQTAGIEYGQIVLPDGHRRERFEATKDWASAMRGKFADMSASPAVNNFAELCIKRIQSRAKNQLVNSMIQGSCATLAKQSIINLIKLLDEAGISDKVRFMLPVHDELVYSVHRDVIMIFLPLLRKAMCDHPNVMRKLPLDCTVAIGRSFRPYDETPFSQWELDEAKPFEGVIPKELQGQKLDDDMVERVVRHLMDA